MISRLSPLLICAFLTLFYFALVDNARGPVYPQLLKDFNMTSSVGSYFFAIASACSLIVTISSNYWLRFISLQHSFLFSWILLGASALMISLSAITYNLPLLFISSALIGSGMGCCSMGMNLSVEDQAPIHLRRQVFAGLHTTYGVSSLMAPLLYSFAIASGVSWSNYFLYLGLLGFAGLLLPRKQKPVFAKKNHEAKEIRLPLLFLLCLSLCIGTYVACEIVVSTRIVLFLENESLFTKSEATNGLFLFFLFLTGGRLALTLYSWPISSLKLMFISLIATIFLCYLGVTGMPIALAYSGAAMSAFFPSMMDWLSQSFPNSFTQVTSFALSGISAHLLFVHLVFGKIATKFGLLQAMSLPIWLALFSLTMLLVVIYWHKKIRRI